MCGSPMLLTLSAIIGRLAIAPYKCSGQNIFEEKAMRVIRTIVLILVAIGALAPLARPSDFNWHGRLAPGQSVEIKGVNGAIHAERSSGTEVTVEATKSGRHNDPNSVTVQAVPHGDGV